MFGFLYINCNPNVGAFSTIIRDKGRSKFIRFIFSANDYILYFHTKGASKLWDSLATGNNISFYVSDETGKPVENPMYHDIRVLGPKDRFKLNN